MNILLDTHVIIWALTDDPQLTDEAKALIMDPENTVVISAVSLWEIAVKNQKAPRLCPYHEKEILDYCVKAGYLVMDIKAKHILEIRGLRTKPGAVLTNHDPFDRMLIARQNRRSTSCFLMTGTLSIMGKIVFGQYEYHA